MSDSPFDVDDIDVAHRTLEDRGVEFVDAPHKITDIGTIEIWMTFFRDPDRNPLALRSEVKRK